LLFCVSTGTLKVRGPLENVKMTANNARASTPYRKGFGVSRAAQRSALSNGSRLLEHLDGRSAPARRFRDLQASIASDLGGADNCTELQIQLIRSAAGLTILREVLDVRTLNGEQVDTRRYCRIINTLGRIATSLGLSRVPREINSTADTADRDAAFRLEVLAALKQDDEQSEVQA
jgi:hypothetical protein